MSNNTVYQLSVPQRCLRHFFDGRDEVPLGTMQSLSNVISVIDQLSENKTTELQLSSVHAMMDCQRLLKSIRTNRTVKIVRIHGFFLGGFGARLQTRYWQAIGGLPLLEHLHMNYFLDVCLTAGTLKDVLDRARRLEMLSIHDTRLCIGNDSRRISLHNHTSLRAVCISQLSLVGEDSTLDPLISICASTPNLRKLTIRMAQPQSNLLTTGAIALLAGTHIQTLELRRAVLDENKLIHLMGILNGRSETNLSQSLKELTLECDECLKESGCVAIGQMLQTNSTLEKLELWGLSRMDDAGIGAVAKALQSNRKLKVLRLSHENISQECQRAFLEMLQHNFYLESIVLRAFQNETFLQTLDFYLKMNATQIRRLLLNVNVNAEQILDKILVHSNNLDYVFHLLRGNPHFVSL